jgi:hypothetical protein
VRLRVRLHAHQLTVSLALDQVATPCGAHLVHTERPFGTFSDRKWRSSREQLTKRGPPFLLIGCETLRWLESTYFRLIGLYNGPSDPHKHVYFDGSTSERATPHEPPKSSQRSTPRWTRSACQRRYHQTSSYFREHFKMSEIL